MASNNDWDPIVEYLEAKEVKDSVIIRELERAAPELLIPSLEPSTQPVSLKHSNLYKLTRSH